MHMRGMAQRIGVGWKDFLARVKADVNVNRNAAGTKGGAFGISDSGREQ
jgi:hypothetical protein